LKKPSTPKKTKPPERPHKIREQAEHFAAKEKWKNLPGNRYDLTKAEPPPRLDFHFNKELAGFQFDWA
jgi:hypothetical protein